MDDLFNFPYEEFYGNGKLRLFAYTLLASFFRYLEKFIKEYGRDHELIKCVMSHTRKYNVPLSKMIEWGKLVEEDFRAKNCAQVCNLTDPGLAELEKTVRKHREDINNIKNIVSEIYDCVKTIPQLHSKLQLLSEKVDAVELNGYDIQNQLQQRSEETLEMNTSNVTNNINHTLQSQVSVPVVAELRYQEIYYKCFDFRCPISTFLKEWYEHKMEQDITWKRSLNDRRKSSKLIKVANLMVACAKQNQIEVLLEPVPEIHTTDNDYKQRVLKALRQIEDRTMEYLDRREGVVTEQTNFTEEDVQNRMKTATISAVEKRISRLHIKQGDVSFASCQELLGDYEERCYRFAVHQSIQEKRKKRRAHKPKSVSQIRKGYLKNTSNTSSQGEATTNTESATI
jgi:hypothetical protein